jgi:hypothetical protein
MTKQDAPARIEAKSERPAHASRQFFPFEKKSPRGGSRSRALRRDECGDWRINGKRGHI